MQHITANKYSLRWSAKPPTPPNNFFLILTPSYILTIDDVDNDDDDQQQQWCYVLKRLTTFLQLLLLLPSPRLIAFGGGGGEAIEETDCGWMNYSLTSQSSAFLSSPAASIMGTRNRLCTVLCTLWRIGASECDCIFMEQSKPQSSDQIEE